MIAILLHGFTGDRTTWDVVREHWQPELPPSSSLVALDLPGHGDGPPVRDGWLANLQAVRELAGPLLPEAVVIGYSLGARVALGLLAEGMARRAILIGVNPGLSPSQRAQRRIADREWIELLRSEGLDAFCERWESQALFSTQHDVPAPQLEARRALRRRQQPAQLALSLEHMGLGAMPDYRSALAGLARRAELVVGARDLKFLEIAKDVISRTPDVLLHLVADAGHDVVLEQPHRVSQLLSQFCAVSRA